MKKKLQEIKHAITDYWRSRSKDRDSNKVSRGALFISRIIPWARGEYWRKNHGHAAPKKHNKNKS